MGTSRLYLMTLLVAFCSMLYELILAQCLSIILGNSMVRFATTVGLYLFCLGMGALFAERVKAQSAVAVFLWIELVLAIVGGLVPFWSFAGVFALESAAVSWGATLEASWLNLSEQLFLHALIVGIGLLSGFEIPLLMSWGEELGGKTAARRVLAVDYLGTFLATVFFPLVLFPRLGLVAVSALVGIGNVAVVFLCWQPSTAGLRRIYAFSLALGLVLCLALGFEQPLGEFLIQKLFFAYGAG